MQPLRLAAIGLVVFISSALSSPATSQEAVPGLTDLDSLLEVRISTASKYEQTAGEAPAAVTIVTAEEIARFGYRTLTEVLENVRGFYSTNDRLLDYIGTRGFNRTADNNNRLLLMINGHTMNESYFGSSYYGDDLGLNLDAVERIEIVRGPGSVLYGTSAMFAVINVITRDGAAVNGMKAYGELGSYGRRTAGLTAGRLFSNGLDVSLSGRVTRADGADLYFPEYDSPQTNNGVARDCDWERQRSLLATAAWGDFSFLGFLGTRKKGVPTSPWGIDFNIPATSFLEEYKLTELKYEHRLSSGHELMLRTYVDHYGQRGHYFFDGVIGQEKFAENHYGSEVRYLWDPKPYLRLIAGAEFQKHPRAFFRSWGPDKVYFDQDHPFHTWSAYLEEELQLRTNLLLTLGLRHDKYASRSNSTVPRAALVWAAARGSSVKLLYGEAFRAPNVNEVFYDAPSIAQGNPNLKPEKIQTFELVLESRLAASLHGTLSFYDNSMRDFIEQVEASEDQLSHFVNAGRLRARGIETGLKADFASRYGVYLNYAYQLPRNRTNGYRLPNSPRNLVQAGASASLPHGLSAALQCRYSSSRRSDKGVTADAFTLFDLNLAGEIVPDRLRLAFKVRNLFDSRYDYPAGLPLLQAVVPQNGRTVQLRLECWF
ncbi:TonB-dependent receptor [bacterium]|nr:TonB-dependent receptor [bacterium]